MIRNDIPKPEISGNFTIDDIHKIREWNYERLKDATIEERIADINTRAAPLLAELEVAKNKKPSTHNRNSGQGWTTASP